MDVKSLKKIVLRRLDVELVKEICKEGAIANDRHSLYLLEFFSYLEVFALDF